MIKRSQRQHEHVARHSNSIRGLTIRTSIFKIYYQTIFLLEKGRVKAVIFCPSHYLLGGKINGEAAVSGRPSFVSEGLTPIGRAGRGVG